MFFSSALHISSLLMLAVTTLHAHSFTAVATFCSPNSGDESVTQLYLDWLCHSDMTGLNQSVITQLSIKYFHAQTGKKILQSKLYSLKFC